MDYSKFKRIAVVGGPVTGKSAVLESLPGRPVVHSDSIDWSGGFSEHSQAVKEACEGHESFVVAGVAADRAIRKGLEVDLIIHCTDAQQPLTKGQRTLKKQVDQRVKDLGKKTRVVKYRHGRD